MSTIVHHRQNKVIYLHIHEGIQRSVSSDFLHDSSVFKVIKSCQPSILIDTCR